MTRAAKRRIRRHRFLAASLLLAAACSSGDDEVAPGTGPLCANVMEKLRACGVYGDGALPCVDGITLGVEADVGFPVSLREPTDNSAYNANLKCIYECLMAKDCETLIKRGCGTHGFDAQGIAFDNGCPLICQERTFPCSLASRFQGVCNQRNDCPSGEDEIGCPDTFICGAGDIGRPLFAAQRCDGRDDCRKVERLPDGTFLEEPGDDEVDCPGELFQCPDGRTLPSIWVCDGVFAHCDGAEDEAACPDNFYCDDGSFLPMTSVCDGSSDCDDGEDEAGCAAWNESVCQGEAS